VALTRILCNAKKTLFRHFYLFLLCLQKSVGNELRRPELRQRIEPNGVDDDPDIVTPFSLLLKQCRRARLLHLHQPRDFSTANSHVQSTIPKSHKVSNSKESYAPTATLRCHAVLTSSRFKLVLTLGQEVGLRRVKPCSWSVYRSNSSPSEIPLSPSAASASDAEATGSCGDDAGMGRTARSSEPADNLRVRSGGEEEASHLGATARARYKLRLWRQASESGGPRRGQPTSGIGCFCRRLCR